MEFAAQNPFNSLTQESGELSRYPHRWFLSYLYELLFGPGKKYRNHGVASKSLGGWEVSGVQRTRAARRPSSVQSFNGIPGQPMVLAYSMVPGLSRSLIPTTAPLISLWATGCTEIRTEHLRHKT